MSKRTNINDLDFPATSLSLLKYDKKNLKIKKKKKKKKKKKRERKRIKKKC
jgi:hypothetical protein